MGGGCERVRFETKRASRHGAPRHQGGWRAHDQQPEKNTARKSKKSCELMVSSALVSAAGSEAKKLARKSKKSWEFAAPSQLKSAMQAQPRRTESRLVVSSTSEPYSAAIHRLVTLVRTASNSGWVRHGAVAGAAAEGRGSDGDVVSGPRGERERGHLSQEQHVVRALEDDDVVLRPGAMGGFQAEVEGAAGASGEVAEGRRGGAEEEAVTRRIVPADVAADVAVGGEPVDVECA